jgi:hypothetical protein
MPGIAQELEFVAVKSVAAIGEHVGKRHCGGNGQQEQGFGPVAGIQSP